MRNVLYLIALTTLISVQLKSQTSEDVKAKTESAISHGNDSTTINMTIDMSNYLHLMDSIDAISSKSTGYRTQVFSSSGPNARKDALQSQSDFLKIYRDYPSYTKWNYPNWVVRLGDYRTHLEAMEFHNEITSLFPASFIVKDEINVE